MANSKKKLSIIIVTFESCAVIENCLSKINFDKYDTYVVDNNSKDKTTRIVEEKFPQVNLIKLDKNTGYGRANNVALKKSNTPYALILNPDAFIFESDIEIVIKAMDKNKDVGLASPSIFVRETPMSDDEFKGAISGIDQESLKQGYIKRDFIAGGVLCIRKSAFKDNKFFDEDFFMFAEDNELCDKSLANGYQNVVIFNARSYHLSGLSSTPNLRNRYRRFWHLGWSKSLYRKRRKGFFGAKRATLRLSIVYFIEGLVALICFNKLRIISKFAFSFGCFASFIGLKSFKKDGTPRG